MRKVTQAQARAKGRTSRQLGIAFDHAILKDGLKWPVFVPQSRQWGNSESAASAAAADDSAMMGGTAGGMARNSGFWRRRKLSWRAGWAESVRLPMELQHDWQRCRSTLHTGNVAGANTATNATGGLTSTSQGVVGMPGMTLSSVALVRQLPVRW